MPPRGDVSISSSVSTITNLFQLNQTLQLLDSQYVNQVEHADQSKIKFARETSNKLAHRLQIEDGQVHNLDSKLQKLITCSEHTLQSQLNQDKQMRRDSDLHLQQELH